MAQDAWVVKMEEEGWGSENFVVEVQRDERRKEEGGKAGRLVAGNEEAGKRKDVMSVAKDGAC